ncbi:MAG: PQQ-dependent sugar dehydrogenase [Cellvibrionaceae bacterium]
MKKSISLLICLLSVLHSVSLFAQANSNSTDSLDSHYVLETVVEGISVPWGMAWLPNGDMLITNRKGELHRFSNGKLSLINGLPAIHANGQGGLLDIELHPTFSENGWIYFSFSSEEGKGNGSNTAIMRAKLNADKLVEKEFIYKAAPNSRRGQHYGSRIEFDNSGYLFFSIGDRGARNENPQDITKEGGKIYRLHDDGKIPSDNPFVGKKDAREAIYSFGHRNPQGMAKNPTTGDIWVHEHGPRGGDEVNIVKPAKNYGWPILSYGINYNGTDFAEGTEREGFEQPIWYWVPSIAPSGMAFVTSDKYPAWKGNLLVGSLKFAYLVLCDVEGNEIKKADVLFKGIGRVRNIRQGPDGFIYVATEGQGIKRIIPKK